MSRLTETMHEIADRHFELRNCLNVHEAARELMQQADEEEREQFAFSEVCRRFKAISCRARAAAKDDTETQADLPFSELRKAYAIDLDDRIIRPTEQLTQLEFRRIIEIREQQVIADRKHLEELKRVYSSLSPYWDRNPDWTLANVAMLYVGDRQELFA